jgi:hypothetical protein
MSQLPSFGKCPRETHVGARWSRAFAVPGAAFARWVSRDFLHIGPVVAVTPNCECNQPTKMLTVLPKFGEHPTYHIACGYVNWFPQPLSEKDA